MNLRDALQHFIVGNPLAKFLAVFLVGTFLVNVFRGFFLARKIQPNGFKWRTFRNEIFFAAIGLPVSGFLIGGLSGLLHKHGLITVIHAPTHWWVIATEYTLYFIAFDTWFYWFHRLMHVEPIYTYVHKIHHFSTAPNILTTFSLNPLESFVNSFTPVFTAIVSVHDTTLALMAPTQVLMGLYVHSGYEFLPRWWNKTWLTRWFITATFHDQHHKYFNWNFGGFSPVWDWICGTVRPKYSADFDRIKARTNASLTPLSPAASGSG